MRFVVKIGTNLLTNEDHSLNTVFIKSIASQVAELKKAGHEPMIVTSGAVAAGRRILTLKKENKHVPYRKALAAIGQAFLLDTYRDAFEPYGMPIGQILLTMADFEKRENFLSTYNTFQFLLKNHVVPIINENDVTTLDKMGFGDNDTLSAHVASLMGAEKLIILTDVVGLCDDNPKQNPNAKVIEVVEKITPQIQKLAPTENTKKTRGGMGSKLNGALYATESGVIVHIANGDIPNVLCDLILERVSHGTRFERQFTPREARRKWLHLQRVRGAAIIVDDGAKTAITERGKSLLPSGIKGVEGAFNRGDVVTILDMGGEKVGFGQINYGAEEMHKIKGLHSEKIIDALGYVLEEVAMHRDNMVM